MTHPNNDEINGKQCIISYQHLNREHSEWMLGGYKGMMPGYLGSLLANGEGVKGDSGPSTG